MLDKGVPSTFANLKHLYSNSFKKETLPSVVLAYIETKKDSPSAEPKVSGDTSKGDSAAFYFLAQHYNYYLSRDLAQAMEYIDKAIELEPKSVDFHMTKARIWKHYGNTQKASETMEQARLLDTRDRYINTKAAKYQLRNDENETALKTLGLFTRAETVGGPLADLQDMQCMWFLTEDGESHARQNNFGLALKRFACIQKVFDVWQEDQFDFHSFSLRKGQIRAYVEMMRWEDHLREHPSYTRAALAAVKVYLKIHDKPLTNGANGSSHDDDDDDDAAAKKKAAKKAKKDAQKAADSAASKKNEPNKPKDADGQAKKIDQDPNGLLLAGTTEPLVEAMKFLTPLLELSPKNIECQLIGFEVFIRRGKQAKRSSHPIFILTIPTAKYLQALKCLLAADSIDSSNPTVHSQAIRFQQAISNATLSPKVAEVIKFEFTLPASKGPSSDLNEKFLSQHNSSARHIISALRTRSVLASNDQSKNESVLLEILTLPTITFEEAAEGLELLKSWRSSQEDTYRSKAALKWPEATVFTKSK
jgi:tetratricopeptide (TPR) repeat protein